MLNELSKRAIYPNIIHQKIKNNLLLRRYVSVFIHGIKKFTFVHLNPSEKGF